MTSPTINSIELPISLLSHFRSFIARKLVRNTVVFSMAEVANKAIPFLLLPIVTRYMGPADYGKVAVFMALTSVLAVFVGLSSQGAVSVAYFKLRPEELQKYVANVLVILCSSTAVVLFLLLTASRLLSALLGISRGWIVVAAIVALAQFITLINLVLWQVEERSIPYAIYQVSQTLFSAVLILLMVAALNLRWSGQLKAMVISTIVFAILSLGFIFRRGYLQVEIHREYLRDALAFGLPLIPHALSGWILTGVDRFYLTLLQGSASTGLYATGYQFGLIIGILAASFNRAWAPFLFGRLECINTQGKIKIVKTTYIYFIGILLLALALSVIGPWFISFYLGGQFRAASQFVFWVALGYAFDGMYYMVVNPVLYMNKTKWLATITFSVGLCHMIGSYALIRLNGSVGAAQATTFSFFLTFVLVWILSSKVYPMPWRFWRCPSTTEAA
jgi:O-antigen/teichoic acid export membrane protein